MTFKETFSLRCRRATTEQANLSEAWSGSAIRTLRERFMGAGSDRGEEEEEAAAAAEGVRVCW